MQRGGAPLVMPEGVGTEQVVGLVNLLERLGPTVSFSRLLSSFGRDFGVLLPVLSSAELLGLVSTERGNVSITDFGRRLLEVPERRFRTRVLKDALARLEPFSTALALISEKGSVALQEVVEALEVKGIRWHRGTESDEEVVDAMLIDWGIPAQLLSYDGKVMFRAHDEKEVGPKQETVLQTAKKTTAIIEGQDLSFSYTDTKPVFKGVNLSTFQDEFVAIVGPTGTGKSTLLRVLAQLIPPTSGRVLLDGNVVSHPSSKISLVHQSIATFPWMTALDNVKLVLLDRRMEDAQVTQTAEKMLELVGLRGVEGEYPKEMSGGMRQRVAIARALAAAPEVLLLDEPFVHLDELTANEIRSEVYRLVFNPETTLKSAILVSHNLHEVVQLADRVHIMNGSPSTIVDVVKIDLPRPRSERDPAFLDYVDKLYRGLNVQVSPKA